MDKGGCIRYFSGTVSEITSFIFPCQNKAVNSPVSFKIHPSISRISERKLYQRTFCQSFLIVILYRI